jgi:hypothetical protein
MVEIFFDLVEKIIELLKLQKQKKENVFNEIIEPLFKEMPIIVSDYLNLFNEAHEKFYHWKEKKSKPESYDSLILNFSNKELKAIINSFKKRREDLLPTRIKVREMADLIIQEFDDKLINEFAENIHQLFYNWKVYPHRIYSRSGSSSQSLVELFELLEKSEIYEEDFAYHIAILRNNTLKSWSAITRSYASLRIIHYYKKKLSRKKKSV